ncbi:MAG TPA: class I SAM-dependent methyltransferase [Thermoanaerobaculia bacterium]|nr:class I SAM-dependent methyltransferase [Thermoanaerobaculia bacterium]
MHTHQWGTQPEMFGPRHEHRLSIILTETKRLTRGSRVLDAAVGLGQLAQRLQQQGLRPFGIDAAFEAVLHVKRTTGVPVVLGDLTKMPFRAGAFDGVTTGETLEHLDNDAGAAREIGRILKEGGLCVATVPALQSLWSASDAYYQHRRRYARDELTALFRDGGMSIEIARYWGFPVVLAYDTLFLLPMNRRRARADVERDPALQSVARAGRSQTLIKIVRAAFAIDRLFSFVPFGPGLLLVGRKLHVE